MKKPVKKYLKVGIAIIVVAAVVIFLFHSNTKAHSPEDTVSYDKGVLHLEVFYNRPYKRDREIFGELIPYNKVWRTGANEATTFSTNKDILIDGSLLKAGKYTLWTIPRENSWKVIFNDKMYPWGINLDEEAYRDAAFDALVLEAPVKKLKDSLDQFTIKFTEQNDFIYLQFAWDKTILSIPIKQE